MEGKEFIFHFKKHQALLMQNTNHDRHALVYKPDLATRTTNLMAGVHGAQ